MEKIASVSNGSFSQNRVKELKKNELEDQELVRKLINLNKSLEEHRVTTT